MARAASSPLSQIEQIRFLPRGTAAQKLPVRLSGVVALHTVSGVFLEDDGYGIWANIEKPHHQLEEGQQLEIEGVTDVTGYTPRILVSKFAIIGKAALPEARRVPIEKLLSGSEDCQRIELEGVIQQAVPPTGIFSPLLVMATEGQLCRVKIINPRNVDPTYLVDARVRVRGIFQAQVNLRNQAAGLEIQTRLQDIEVITPAAADPFRAAKVPLPEIMAFSPAETVGHRRLVAGTVSFIYPGKFLYLVEGKTSLRIDTARTDLEPGDQIEVAGFPSQAHTLVSLGGAIIRKTGRSASPRPVAADLHQILKPLLTDPWAGSAEVDASGRLVTLKGRLLRVITNPENTMKTLLIDSEGDVFSAFVPAAGIAENTWRPGSDLELTGACELEFKQEPDDPQSITHPISGFHLWLASANGVRVLQKPSWWTPQRFALALGSLALVLFIALVWVVILRREVSRRGHALAREISARRETKLEFETTMRERTRLATDLHDNLEQTLTGLSLQLQAAELFRAKDGKRSSHHIQLAQQFLDRSRDDLHRTVWDLRALGMDGKSLVEALREKAERITPGSAVTIHVDETGISRPLPDFIAGNLLLLAQEAMTNALKHAGASAIHVCVNHRGNGVTVSIRDDGRGFDPAMAPNHHEGHFGLQGMRERIKRLGGIMELTSSPGNGTCLSVWAPTNTDEEEESSDSPPE